MKHYRTWGIVTSGHRLMKVSGYEDLWQCLSCHCLSCHCLSCHCAEGTLPDQCPGVPVPSRVQTMIHRGVVNFSNGRWVGENSPSRRMARAIRSAGVSLHQLADSTQRAQRVILAHMEARRDR